MEKKEEEITIKKSQLDEIMAKIGRLEAVASKNKLIDFDRSIKEKGKKVVGLRVIKGKVVVGWSDMIENNPEKNQAGVWRDNQKVEIEYEDGKKEKMSYIIFNRSFTPLLIEVSKETKNEDGTTTFVGKTSEGKEYTINNKFLK